MGGNTSMYYWGERKEAKKKEGEEFSKYIKTYIYVSIFTTIN
jgi:hypothetical protein